MLAAADADADADQQWQTGSLTYWQLQDCHRMHHPGCNAAISDTMQGCSEKPCTAAADHTVAQGARRDKHPTCSADPDIMMSGHAFASAWARPAVP